MVIPAWIWIVFTFAFGCSIGSFINVVIYRLPRDRSLVRPGSSCPACGDPIRFYDNIPLLSWLLLAGKCRRCKAPISPRYFIVELIVGVLFTGLYLVYFHTELRRGIGPMFGRGAFIYVVHVVMLAALVAASGIDLEHWVIPLSICWLITALGLVASLAGPLVIDPRYIKSYTLLPFASPATAALAGGAAAGLAISLILLATKVLKRSYEGQSDEYDLAAAPDQAGSTAATAVEPQYNDRAEVLREVLFLLPIIAGSAGLCWFLRWHQPAGRWWADFSQIPAVAGLLGAVWGYFVGCAVVWGTRIFGTLLFGREAMGLGDVHLMGAAGAVVGPMYIVVAFFIAPFFGLAWALCQMFFKKIRQIPYGPFLSLGILTVMIFHDWIWDRLLFWFRQ
ncbi:MAG TPA: prepilin peptidase [Phycisphaerales bacterium]|nr:prepilin peptidase [Phycisphaerales bacterium]